MNTKKSFGRVYRSMRRSGGSTSLLGLARASLATAELGAQIESIKHGLVKEYSSEVAGYDRVLRSAINEAEAVAWQSGYPYLLFPTLAQEKASVVKAWALKQRQIQDASLVGSFAA